LGATQLQQLEDSLGAADLALTEAEIAQLDATTPLPPVYPNWFIDNLSDRAAAQPRSRAGAAAEVVCEGPSHHARLG
jgi:hypothetical protein